MKIVIRNEREYWDTRVEAERLSSASRSGVLTEDGKRTLGALSHVVTQYELRKATNVR